MRNDNRRAPQRHKASSVRRKRARWRSNAHRRSNGSRGRCSTGGTGRAQTQSRGGRRKRGARDEEEGPQTKECGSSRRRERHLFRSGFELVYDQSVRSRLTGSLGRQHQLTNELSNSKNIICYHAELANPVPLGLTYNLTPSPSLMMPLQRLNA